MIPTPNALMSSGAPAPLSTGIAIDPNCGAASGAPTPASAENGIVVLRPRTLSRICCATTLRTRLPPTSWNDVITPQVVPASSETSIAIVEPGNAPTTSIVLGTPIVLVSTAAPAPFMTGSGRFANTLGMEIS